MDFQIVPIADDHIAGFHAGVDAVAREKLYLAMLKAPPLEESAKWVRNNIRKGFPQMVALVEGRVVGWCDVSPMERETLAHGGVLGMGVIDGFRGKGIGLALMRATLERAKAGRPDAGRTHGTRGQPAREGTLCEGRVRCRRREAQGRAARREILRPDPDGAAALGLAVAARNDL